MDVGPFFSSGLEVPLEGKKKERPSLKTISIKLGPDATVAFDTERLRMATGWTGGFLKLPSGREGLEGVPQPEGDIVFRTALLPGWGFRESSMALPTLLAMSPRAACRYTTRILKMALPAWRDRKVGSMPTWEPPF